MNKLAQTRLWLAGSSVVGSRLLVHSFGSGGLDLSPRKLKLSVAGVAFTVA
ncbi:MULTISPECIES: hypothetical protein [Nitrosomonas]|uniref:hypothetical protein n=1 Tax=Nitrosomonas TaxID=914 RepID=UPI00130EF54A|nr:MULTISPECIES: hypothetical protein [Nitrosomonas]UVS63263.1 hypothetical protein NX761_09315 [Nitrosomonas sp. PLL12]